MTNVSNEILAINYSYATFQANGNSFTVLEAKGKLNYISVSKNSNNPFGKVSGRQFKNWDEAISTYKSADMKVGLLLAKLGINK